MLGNVQESIRELRFAAWLWGKSAPDSNVGDKTVLEAETGNVKHALTLLANAKSRTFFDSRPIEARIRLLEGDLPKALMLASAGRKAKAAAATLAVMEALIRLGRAAEAIDTLVESLRRARSRGAVHLELECLLLLADAHRRLHELPTAREHLDDLDEPAARGQYRYIQAKAAVVRAELERDEGNKPAAIAAATDAYRLAWCDGPPYTYYWTLKRADELLRELGASVPDMP
jgi:tetratricopeptide (TPR) repeat protein